MIDNVNFDPSEHERVDRVRSGLGITVQLPSANGTDRFGLGPRWGPIIRSVDSNGVAHGAGLRAGDMILNIDGKDVHGLDGSSKDIVTAVVEYFSALPAGHVLVLLIRRNEQDQTLKVIL